MNLIRKIFKFFINITIGRKTAMYWLASTTEKKLLDFMTSGYLYQNGWFRSIEENKSINLKGEPIAWLPYSLLQFIDSRLTNSMNVLEFGSGGSSFYFSKRAKHVVSVEDNQSWYDKLSINKPDNLSLIYSPTKENYININDHSHFDLILVDGEFREECLMKSINYVSNVGVILLDDTDKPEFGKLVPLMVAKGFKTLVFNDFAPIVNYNKKSTLFYREGNCFGI